MGTREAYLGLGCLGIHLFSLNLRPHPTPPRPPLSPLSLVSGVLEASTLWLLAGSSPKDIH